MMQTIGHLLHHYSYALILGVIALECAGIILPGETVLVTASLYAAHGHLSIALVLASAACGAMLGNIAGFMIGRAIGQRVLARHGRRIGLTDRRLALGRYMFARHGGKMVFFSRFAAVLRSFSALLAGANLMAWQPFVLWSLAGAIVWPSVTGMVVFALGNAARRLSGTASIVFGVLAAAVILTVLILARRNEDRLTEAALEWERHGSA